jgi:hypothetical protein
MCLHTNELHAVELQDEIRVVIRSETEDLRPLVKCGWFRYRYGTLETSPFPTTDNMEEVAFWFRYPEQLAGKDGKKAFFDQQWRDIHLNRSKLQFQVPVFTGQGINPNFAANLQRIFDKTGFNARVEVEYD